MTTCPSPTFPTSPPEPTGTLTLDPAVLLEARRTLLRLAQGLDEVHAPPPDTGPTTAATVDAFARVTAGLAAAAADLRDLAAAVRHHVDDIAEQDGHVGLMFDLLRMRRLS